MPIRNLWSLNTDELLAADKLKDVFNKNDYEVFFPLNNQLKDVDLLLVNLKNNKVKSIQVKGSRTWEPRKAERERYGEGSAAWFKIHRKYIFEPRNKVDFYIFVLHNFVDGYTRKEIKIDYLVLPIKDFQAICGKKFIRRGNFYHFFIWIDSKGKRAFDFNNSKNNMVPLSKFLNNWQLIK